MTNPDLVKLADELIEVIPRYHDDESVLEAAVAALRRLASSDGGVKVRELEWSGDGIAQCVFGFYDVSGMGNGTYRVTKPNCYLMPTIFSDMDAAKASAQADYEARIRSALVEVPAVKGEPVAWHDGAPPKPWADEWFIAETIYHERVVLRSLPEEYTYDFKTADETYIKAANIKRWMQFPDSEYIASPADAGMREAFIRVLASLAAAISILERTPKAKKAVASDKMFDTMLDDYRKALEAGRKALTAPSATTKSDGGWNEAIEACIQAVRQTGNFGDYKREELTADYGRPKFDMMNAIINALTALRSEALTKSDGGGESRPAHPGTGGRAPCIEQTTPATMPAQAGVAPGPSDPSPTRSDVTVEKYERAIIAWADGEEIELTIRQVHALARALLRRKS